jgi:hypothetical protein
VVVDTAVSVSATPPAAAKAQAEDEADLGAAWREGAEAKLRRTKVDRLLIAETLREAIRVVESILIHYLMDDGR